MRTTEQGEIARYWYEDSTKGWNRVARVLAGRSWWRGFRQRSGGTSVARQPDIEARAAKPP